MTKPIIKVIAIGIFTGLALFAFPFFILKSFLFVLILGIVFRILFHQMRFRKHRHFAFSVDMGMQERFKNMTPAERKDFFFKMKGKCRKSNLDTSQNNPTENQ